jgi:hypothetical protein
MEIVKEEPRPTGDGFEHILTYRCVETTCRKMWVRRGDKLERINL